MAFTFIAVAHADQSAVSSATCNKPAGTAQNDIMFAWIGLYNVSDYVINSVPDGWTLQGSLTTNPDKHYLYSKVAGASEPSDYTWGTNGTTKFAITIVTYRDGFDTADPIDVVSDTSYRESDATVRAASMNVLATNSPLVFFGAVYKTSEVTFTKPSVPTEDWVEDVDYWNTFPDFAREVCSMTWGGSGATGNMDATATVTTTVKHAFAVALNPPTEAGEFPYSGNIPLAALSSYLSAVIMAYGGAVSIAATPSYQSILDRLYGGQIPLALSPASPAGFEKGYEGQIPLAALPSYLSALEKAYDGEVPLSALPSYLSSLHRIYAGEVPLEALPSYLSSFEKGYEGQIPLSALPSYLSSLHRLYDGQVPLAVAPLCVSSMEKGYDGAVTATLLPSHLLALEKFYDGQIAIAVVPSAIYSLLGAEEYIYLGQVAVSLLPTYLSVLERSYDGALPLSLSPSYQSILDRLYAGEIPIVIVPSCISSFEEAFAWIYSGEIPIALLISAPYFFRLGLKVMELESGIYQSVDLDSKIRYRAGYKK